MVNIAKENLCIHKLVTEKTEIIFSEGDMIVPDSKPDILNTICTSGVACIYKRELQENKLKIDGGVNTYIMYMPEGMDEGVRGINTTLDFSQVIDIEDNEIAQRNTTVPQELGQVKAASPVHKDQREAKYEQPTDDMDAQFQKTSL